MLSCITSDRHRGDNLSNMIIPPPGTFLQVVLAKNSLNYVILRIESRRGRGYPAIAKRKKYKKIGILDIKKGTVVYNCSLRNYYCYSSSSLTSGISSSSMTPRISSSSLTSSGEKRSLILFITVPI